MRRATPGHPKMATPNRPTRNPKHSAEAEHAKRQKRRLFYGLLAGILVFQGIVFPSMVSSSSSGASSAQNSPPVGSLRASSSPPDATLNGYPLRRSGRDSSFRSAIHCAGETHNEETAWMHRSCEFTNLCIDTATLEFYLVDPGASLRRLPGAYVSTDPQNLTVALGGINPRWAGKGYDKGIEKVRWFPNVVPELPSDYYSLDERVTLLPFHSLAAHNVGHMLWDDFLPIYTLLQLFGLVGEPLLMMRMDTLLPLYGTCDMTRNKNNPNPRKLAKCKANFEKFLPLLGVRPDTFSTAKTLRLEPSVAHESSSSLPTWVCAKRAVAGLGMLTDHGLKDHGWLMPKEQAVQNTAKGFLLYEFRGFVLRNLGLPEAPPPPTSTATVVLSAHSSGYVTRDAGFARQQERLSEALADRADVRTVELAGMGVQEQVELATTTRVFVSVCGGGAMTATFLPRGATLILYYAENGGFDFANDRDTGQPAFLDWDLFNNMSYLRVHWLPLGTMDTEEGLDTLQRLIDHELESAN